MEAVQCVVLGDVRQLEERLEGRAVLGDQGPSGLGEVAGALLVGFALDSDQVGRKPVDDLARDLSSIRVFPEDVEVLADLFEGALSSDGEVVESGPGFTKQV